MPISLVFESWSWRKDFWGRKVGEWSLEVCWGGKGLWGGRVFSERTGSRLGVRERRELRNCSFEEEVGTFKSLFISEGTASKRREL